MAPQVKMSKLKIAAPNMPPMENTYTQAMEHLLSKARIDLLLMKPRTESTRKSNELGHK